jgi:glutamate mutase epsilon subunit
MDIKNMKVSIGIVIAIVAQAFGIIWYVAQLDSTVKNLDITVNSMQESAADIDLAVLQTDFWNLKDKVEILSLQEQVDISPLERTIVELETSLGLIKETIDGERDIRHTTLDDFESRLDDIETTNAVINNEMRTIMSDHSGFAEVLRELELSGLLPSGEKRTYGNYGN